jgi:alkaline phosphatase
MNRRDWIRSGLAAGAGLAAAKVTPRWGPERLDARPAVRARSVIFFAYDGLTWEDVGTLRYHAMRRDLGLTHLERLLSTGASGSMLPHSLTSVVTDSAAASTAWATGRKIVNYAVSQFPDGTRLATILELGRDAGLATGLVTTTRLTHATPACWAAHVEDRNMEDEIAVQYLDHATDVLMGGGSVHFDPDFRSDGRDVFGAYRDAGYQVLRRQDEVAGASGSRLLGVFTPGHLAYEIDRVYQDAHSPSLDEITRKGLEVLDEGGRGFVLQVEAGRVDHANHQNDPGAALHDLLAADRALGTVLDYADRTPETLVIVASDHGTGSGAVYGTGTAYLDSSPSFDRITLPRCSYQHFRAVLGRSPSAAEVATAAEELLGEELDGERAARVQRVLAREIRPGHERAYRDQPDNALHYVLTDQHPREPGLNVNYATGAHTSGPVPLALYGAGVGSRGLGIVDNTELFGVMTSALGIRHENPTLTEAEALRMGRRPEGERAEERAPHWV